MGTKTSVGDITLDDVKAHASRLLRPSEAVLLVAGDLSLERARTTLERAFGGWQEPESSPFPSPEFPEARQDALRVVLVDRPEAVQTVISFVMPGPVYNDPRRIRLELFNTILGGSFTSRLNLNLREEHGYTYGARSRFSMNPSVGFLTASSSVRADVTRASIDEFLAELEGIRTGDISDEEARKARSSGRMDMIQSFAGLRGLISTATILVVNRRPFSELGEELRAIARVEASDLNEIAREAVPLEKAVLVLVGDADLIGKQLEGSELPEPVLLDASGEPVEKE